MRNRLNAAGLILVSAISLLLLPIAVNVASGSIPGPWRPYLWLSWPSAGLLAALLGVIESRRSRKKCTKASLNSDVTTRPGSQVVFNVEARRDAYTAERIMVIQHGQDGSCTQDGK